MDGKHLNQYIVKNFDSFSQSNDIILPDMKHKINQNEHDNSIYSPDADSTLFGGRDESLTPSIGMDRGRPIFVFFGFGSDRIISFD